MRNYLLAGLLSISVLFSASAKADGFSLGPILGVDFANDDLSVSSFSVSFNSRTGFTGGISGELQVGEWLFFQPELMYIQKGFVVPAANATTGSDTTFAANYLEIPLLMKAKLVTNTINPYFMFGPSPSLKLSANGNSSSGSVKVDNVHTVDIGLHFGVGAEVPVAPSTTVFLDGRYILGLTNIDGDPTDQANGVSVKNRVWLILTGARFALF